MSEALAALRAEWVDEHGPNGYLLGAGFELRADRTWRPPERLMRVRVMRCGPSLSGWERRAIEWLVIAFGYGGLLTDRQHEQRAHNEGAV